jgi:hypothetical protein
MRAASSDLISHFRGRLLLQPPPVLARADCGGAGAHETPAPNEANGAESECAVKPCHANICRSEACARPGNGELKRSQSGDALCEKTGVWNRSLD